MYKDILKRIRKKNRFDQLTGREIFDIKRYNRNLIEEFKGKFVIFPIGAIVVNKEFEFLRFVTNQESLEYFEDTGNILAIAGFAKCKYINYDIIV